MKYIESGSDIILTNTFGGSPFKLAGYGFENKAYQFNFSGIGKFIIILEEGTIER